MTTIQELLDEDIAFMGSHWVDDSDIKDGVLRPGHKYIGEIPYINCSDLFWWGVADGEKITPNDLPFFNQCLMDCEMDLNLAGALYCARKRNMRPQGAYYYYIPENLWDLFNEYGPYREPGIGNPYEIGQYKSLIKD